MRFISLSIAGLASLAATCVFAAERSHVFDDKIAELSKAHGVPEHLIHRVIVRESRYNPVLVHAGNYGLMQIKYATARSMGYGGGANGLRDGVTNLTYAVPYLANAWELSGHNEDRAVRLYAGGYYYVAKKQGALPKMRTAKSDGLKPVAESTPVAQAYAETPSNPIAALFHAMARGSGNEPAAQSAAEQQVAAVEEPQSAPGPEKKHHRVVRAKHRGQAVANAAPLPPKRDGGT